MNNILLFIEWSRTLTHDGHGSGQPSIHQHSCTEKKEVGEEEIGTQTLKIRLWLECCKKHKEGRRFVSYELLIPNLV
jgi:hypothetical protein